MTARQKKYAKKLARAEKRLASVRHRRNVIRTKFRARINAITDSMNKQLARTDTLVEALAEQVDDYRTAAFAED